VKDSEKKSKRVTRVSQRDRAASNNLRNLPNSEQKGMKTTEKGVTVRMTVKSRLSTQLTLRPLSLECVLHDSIRKDKATGPDLNVWRPWAGSLLEALPSLKCYNLHALTIVIITKYTCIYIYFYTL